ncbi:hypothetical protein HRbin07_00109 [bacterium HR07]|nr:hypothetical protein HRbin07_00109 [bacterium HR07]
MRARLTVADHQREELGKVRESLRRALERNSHILLGLQERRALAGAHLREFPDTQVLPHQKFYEFDLVSAEAQPPTDFFCYLLADDFMAARVLIVIPLEREGLAHIVDEQGEFHQRVADYRIGTPQRQERVGVDVTLRMISFGLGHALAPDELRHDYL